MDKIKNDKFKEIQNLKDEEIESFIKNRLYELRNNEDITVGYNSNNYIFNGLLDDKVRVNGGEALMIKKKNVIIDFAGINFDDIDMYRYVIEAARRYNHPIFATMLALDEYLKLRNENREFRKKRYQKIHDNILLGSFFGKDETVSIRKMHETGISFCVQIAGVAHNMLKFLGMESDYVLGICDNKHHAYNLIYPWGRENDAILLDGMRSPYSDVILFSLKKDVKTKLFSEETIKLTEKDLIKAQKRLFGLAPESVNSFETTYSVSYPEYTEVKGYDTVSVEPYKIVLKLVNKGKK